MNSLFSRWYHRQKAIVAAVVAAITLVAAVVAVVGDSEEVISRWHSVAFVCRGKSQDWRAKMVVVVYRTL